MMSFMRIALFGMLVVLAVAPSARADDLFPKAEEARKFMADLKCEFGFFWIYKSGKYKGLATSIGVCIQSYDEGGARKHKFCYARPVDLMTGNWRGVHTYGSVYRVEGTHCSKAALKKLFSWQGGELVGAIRSKAFSADAEIVGDSFDYASTFKKQFQK